MEQLKHYKDLWKNQEISKRWDKTELYNMMHKSSSSLVKWIFYVSLIEFAIYTLLNFFTSVDVIDKYKDLSLVGFMRGVDIFAYGVLAIFMILFYRNYRKIKATQSVKEMMQSILNTRKTVKYYIAINIIAIVVVSIYSSYRSLQLPEYEALIEKVGSFALWTVILIVIFLLVVIVLLIYSLIYGYFLRRLKENYKELTDEIMDL